MAGPEKFRAQKKEKKESFTLPNIPSAEILKLPPEKLAEIAAAAGLTQEKLVAMLEKTAHAYRARKEIQESQDISNVGIARFSEPVSKQQLEEAAELEKSAEKWLSRLYYSEGPGSERGYSRSPLEVKTTKALTQVYAVERHKKVHALFLAGKSIVDAVKEVNAEFAERAKRSANTPAVKDALEKNLQEYYPTKGFGSGSIRNPGGTGDYTSMGGPIGSAIRFDVEHPLNFPKHPRPRRSNDELEPF